MTIGLNVVYILNNAWSPCLYESIPDGRVRGVQNKGDNGASLDFEQLLVGHEFPPASYELNVSVISKYIEAVGGQRVGEGGYVPPLAMAARAMTALSKSLVLPHGTIHVSQELEFHKPVPVGSTVSCRGRVAHKLSRGKLRMLVIGLDVVDHDDEEVLTGKATLIIPE